MWEIMMAIISGKRGLEVYRLLKPEDKKKLDRLAAGYGVSRRQRRKMERDARRLRG